MRIVGDFNKVSDAVKAKIRPLKRGEKANYRLLTGQHDLVSGEMRYGAATVFPLRDKIYDNGNVIEIGVPREIKDGEVTRIKKFVVSAVGDNTLHNGVFTLYGGNMDHQEFYEFFEICNFNKSNKDRDESVEPKIERIDEVAEAEAESVEFDTLTKAMVLAQTMSKEDLRILAAVLNFPSTDHPSVMRNRIKTYAKENPRAFLEKVDDPENKTKQLIKQALEAGIISYQPNEHKILWSKDGTTLARLEKARNGESEIDCFFDWIKQSKNGENILKSITGALKKVE